MKICHICSYFDNILFAKLVDAQREMGIQSRVYYFRGRGREAPNSEHIDVDLRTPFYQYQRIFFYWKHNQVIKDYLEFYKYEKFEIDFAHSLFSNGYIAYQVKKKRGTPYIVMVQNTDLNFFFKRLFWLRITGLKIIYSAEKVIVASESYKEELLNKYIPSYIREEIKNKIVVIPYGIDDLFFNQLKKHKYRSDNKYTILTVGTICLNKNQLFVCKAIEKLKQKGWNLDYVVIGQSKNDCLLNEIKKYDFVKYYSYMSQNDLIDYYQKSDVFVLISKTETFGLVYAEAISQGVPVLYTKMQGFDRQFSEGKVGFHVDSNNLSELMRKIEILLKTRGSLEKKCIISSKKFQWKKISCSYVKMYKSIIEKMEISSCNH